jgi:signal transduction histidine kinase
MVENTGDRKQESGQLHLAAASNRLLTDFALRVHASINADNNVQEILQTTVAEVRQFLGADRVAVSHLDPEGNGRTIAESVDAELWGSTLTWVTPVQEMPALYKLFEGDRIRIINDTSQVPPIPLLSRYYQRFHIKSSLTIMLRVQGQIFGLLHAHQCSHIRPWEKFEVDFLSQLAIQTEIALQQGQLYNQAKILAASLEQQVKERTAELQQRMEELQTVSLQRELLLHAVSHDLRTPVQGMLMVLQHLSCPDETTVPVPMTTVNLMRQSCETQLDLLSSLRHDSEQAQGTAIPTEKPPMDLQQILQAPLREIAPLIQQNHNSVINQIPSDLPPPPIAPQELQRVYDNLLTNAITHNPPGTAITLSAERVTSPGEHLLCTVTDDGTGLTEAQRDRLFRLYVRGLDNPHLTGIGLGLYQCHQIITAHGGRIGVDSAPGNGTQVWFTLPLVAPCP